jgi:hypothetical protein
VTRALDDETVRASRLLNQTGRQCHWILEIHLVDRSRKFGGFYEELLDLRAPDRVA